MPSYSLKGLIDPVTCGWKIMRSDPERLRRGLDILYVGLAHDAEQERRKGNGLPSDWRNRIIRY